METKIDVIGTAIGLQRSSSSGQQPATPPSNQAHFCQIQTFRGKMEKRPLGKTGVSLSVLGYGAAPLGGEFGPIDEAEGISAVKLALTVLLPSMACNFLFLRSDSHRSIDLVQKGVNYFDTSPFYGRTKSEIVLGRALQGVPRESYFLSTKVGRYDLAQFDFSAQRVSVSIDESLQRLGIGYIDLVICHDIEFANLDQIVTETLPALVRLREETKKFKFIGISGLPLAVFKYVLDRTDAVDVILTYCHNTLLDNSVSSMMDYFISKGVGVINASPTGMGLLTRAGPPAWHPAPPEIKSGMS